MPLAAVRRRLPRPASPASSQVRFTASAPTDLTIRAPAIASTRRSFSSTLTPSPSTAPYRWRPRLAAPRSRATDTAQLCPEGHRHRGDRRRSSQGGRKFPPDKRIIYEVNPRGFTMLHPAVPRALRGTLAGLAHPAAIEHIVRLGVTTVELMPVAAWIDERHLPPLGLANAWGYNPVTFFAARPAPRAGRHRRPAEARRGAARGRHRTHARRRPQPHRRERRVWRNAVAPRPRQRHLLPPRSVRPVALRQRHRLRQHPCPRPPRADAPGTRRAPLTCALAGVDGFRFDLAPVLGRCDDGFRPGAPLLTAIANDPVLKDLVLIAEPWDVGPGGYRLGQFPGTLARVERPLSRRCPPLLARRRPHRRPAGDPPRRFRRYLSGFRPRSLRLDQLRRRP